jgi:hypothetical protein
VGIDIFSYSVNIGDTKLRISCYILYSNFAGGLLALSKVNKLVEEEVLYVTNVTTRTVA